MGLRHAEDRWSALLAAVATVVLGLGLVALGATWEGGVPAVADEVASADHAAADGGVGVLPATTGDDPPARLRIPAIEVDEPLTGLGLTADRAMEVPAGGTYDLPGWYVHGPRPGETGPAVVGGHVDSHDGPSVFYRLSELAPGDEVEVVYADGTVVRFEVDVVESHAKEAFPFDEVFGNTAAPRLRLITCGGAFDRGARSYDANVVVFASNASIVEG